MPNNDLTRDTYAPPSINSDDWESNKFSELEVQELFWLNIEKSDSNIAHRKESENSAMNVKTRESRAFDRNLVVYQKI